MKFPKHAKVVFDGKIFKVHQWEQKLFDGTTAVFEGISRPDTAVVIPVIDEKIVYAIQNQPQYEKSYYSLLGGRIEDGEHPLDGAKRELLEEAGMTSDDWELLYEFNPVGKMDWTVFVYAARNCKQVSEPCLDGGEKIELKMCSTDDFIEKVLKSDNFYETDLKTKLLTEPDVSVISDFEKKLGIK